MVLLEAMRHQGALVVLGEDVTWVRTRMGTIETRDGLAVLISAAVRGMPTVKSVVPRASSPTKEHAGGCVAARRPCHQQPGAVC